MEQNLRKSWEILSQKLIGWLEAAIGHLPNFLIAILAFAFFVFLARVAKKLLGKILVHTSDNKAVNGLLQTAVYILILLFGVFAALGVLQLDKTLTSLLAGAGVVGLALGFAFQEIAANFISGIFIAFRKPYKVGDIIEIAGYKGKVEKIHLRTTSLITFQGLEVILPNKEMFTKPLVNLTSTPERRVEIEVGISYGDNLRTVEKVAKEAVGKVTTRLKDRPVELFYKEFGASSINFQVRFWIEYPGQLDFLKATHEAIILIKESFDKNDISIPFPIRTLQFENGDAVVNPSQIRGGSEVV